MTSENLVKLSISISGIGSAFHSLIVFRKKLIIYAVVLVDGIVRWNGVLSVVHKSNINGNRLFQ